MSSTIIPAAQANRNKVEFICPFCRIRHDEQIELSHFPNEDEIIPIDRVCETAREFGFREFLIKITKNTTRPVLRIFPRRKVAI